MLGGSGGMHPRKILNFRPSEITFSRFIRPMNGPHYIIYECKQYKDSTSRPDYNVEVVCPFLLLPSL